jgi:alpha-galactosidase
MWGDIVPQWHGQAPYIGAIMPLLNHASFWTQDTNFWGHSDYDSLEVGNGDLTLEENRSHFAMWAALKSPLIIGTLLRNIKPEILDILMNKDLVAFNQDGVYGRPAKPYKWGVNEDNTWNQTHPAEFWSGVSTRGVHVFAVNTLEEAVVKTVFFNEVPELEDEVEYRVYDMWTGKSVGVFTQAFSQIVARHDTLAIRLVKADEDEDEHAEL